MFTFSFLLGIATKIQRVFQEECLREEEGEPAESKVLHLYSLSGEPHEIIEGIKKDKQTNAFICSVHLVKRHLPARSECRLTPDPPLSACDGQCQCRNGERNALWWLLPLCKSGHNRLDPTGGVVQGLDEEVPVIRITVEVVLGGKKNLMSDMRLVKQKKQSASACSFQSCKGI